MTQAVQKKSEEQSQIFTTDMSVGEILRRSRMYYNLSYTDIERELHIRALQVQALENDKFDHLPGKTYAIGFVRSYSEHLGLDGDKMVKLYKAQMRGALNKPELQFPVCSSESKLPSIGILFFCVVALLMAAIYLEYKSTDQDGAAAIPALPERLSQRNEPSVIDDIKTEIAEISKNKVAEELHNGTALNDLETASGNPDRSLAEVVAVIPQQEQGIVIRLKENSWVELTDEDNQTLVSRVLNKGEEYLIPFRPGLKLSLGNAAGVALTINGQTLPALGAPGEVVRNFPLDFDALKSNDLQSEQ